MHIRSSSGTLLVYVYPYIASDVMIYLSVGKLYPRVDANVVKRIALEREVSMK